MCTPDTPSATPCPRPKFASYLTAERLLEALTANRIAWTPDDTTFLGPWGAQPVYVIDDHGTAHPLQASVYFDVTLGVVLMTLDARHP